MAFPNKPNKCSSHSVRSPALDQVTSEEEKIGIHSKTRSKLVSPHRPRPPAPDRPPVAAKPKLKPPPPPVKVSHSSSQSKSSRHARPSLSTTIKQDTNSIVAPQKEERIDKKDPPIKESVIEETETSSKPPPPLPNSPPSKTRIARSLSSSKVSPSKNSESQNSLPSSASTSSNVSETSTPLLSPVSSPSHYPSATSLCTECASSNLNVNKTPIVSSISKDSPLEDTCTVSPSHDQNLSPDQSAIENKTKATSPLEIIIPANEAAAEKVQTQALKGKTPPPVPKKSKKDTSCNTHGQRQSPSSPPSHSPSSLPTRPPPPSKPTLPKTQVRPVTPSCPSSSTPCPASVPQCRSATLGQESLKNVVTQASDEDCRQTETDASEANFKAEPPPLPKHPPRRPLLKRQKSITSDEKSKSASQASGDKSQKSDDAKDRVLEKRHSDGSTEPGGILDNLNEQNNSKGERDDANIINSNKEVCSSFVDKSKSDQNFHTSHDKESPRQPDEITEISPAHASETEKANVTFREKVTPTRPIPRKRKSIPPSLTDSELSSRSEDHQELSDNTSPQVAKPKKEAEYAEVYISPQKVNEVLNNITEKNVANENHNLTVDDNTKTEPNVLSNDLQFSQNDLSLKGKSLDHGKSLSQEEPEPTCDMLKEIEELLSSKLSSFDIETESEPAPLHSNKDAGCYLPGPQEETPKRPPRPKRDASIQKRKASLEAFRSLSVDISGSQSVFSVDLQLSPKTDSDHAKVAPQKPKRTTLPRVNRSLSDVSGMKDIFSCLDSPNPFSSNTSLNSESEKPALPPRSESLKRSYSSLSQTPPPLPPRNKPCANSSPKVIAKCAGQPNSSSSCQTVNANMNNVNKSQSSSQEPVRHTPSQVHSKTASLGRAHGKEALRSFGSPTGTKPFLKPRPARKAPPPPGPPKRTPTFSSGDKLSKDSSHEIKVHEGLWKREEKSTENSPRSLPDKLSELPSPGVVKTLGKFFRAKSRESITIVRPRKTSIEPACLDISHERGTEVEDNDTDTSKTAETENNQREKSETAAPGEGASETGATETGAPEGASETGAPEGANEEIVTSEPSFGDESSSAHTRLDSQSDVEGEGANGPNISSPSDSEDDAEEIYQSQKKAKKIFNIAKEISSSEKAFVDVLRLLNVDFRNHISKEAEKYDQPIIPSETLNKILQFLPQLQNLNEDLLKDVEQRISQWEESPRISDIFVKKGPFLKLYSTYIGNFENALSAMDEACKKHSRFAAAVKDFETGPKCAKLALKHYMLKPVQRIPQYKLLFTDYLRHLAIDSADYKPTQAALEIVSSVADHANESMRNWDNIRKLLEIQRNLIGRFEVIQPGRVLIKRGDLKKLSRKEMQPRGIFLFSDVLLYTTPVTTGYKLKKILQLATMQVEVSKAEEYRCDINIIGTKKSFSVRASTEEEKEEWLDALKKAIEQKIKSSESYKKHSEIEDKSPSESLLGQKAPVWVQDERVTMCMLCLSEFTITRRRHHCRSCGKIVCKYCSENMAPLQYLDKKLARVCEKCFKTLTKALVKEEQETAGSLDISSDDASMNSAQEGEDNKPTGQGTSTLDRNSAFGFNKMISSLFHKGEKNGGRKKSSSSIPSVLKEIHANDEHSDVSGYLRTLKNHKWKRFWFLVKGNVIYTFQACEDRAAVESMPLLGYTVIEFTTAFEGAEPECVFELVHQNKQFIAKTIAGSSPLGSDKNMQRFIFRADNKSSAEKWIQALKDASQA